MRLALNWIELLLPELRNSANDSKISGLLAAMVPKMLPKTEVINIAARKVLAAFAFLKNTAPSVKKRMELAQATQMSPAALTVNPASFALLSASFREMITDSPYPGNN